MRGSKQVSTPDGEVLELLRGAIAHGALARQRSLLANAGLRIVARLGTIVLRREDRGVARGSRRRVRGSGRVGSGTLAADGGWCQSERVGSHEVRLTKHRLLESSGVVGKVEAVELDIVRDGHGCTVNDHVGSIETKWLHFGRPVCEGVIRTLREAAKQLQ